MKKHVGFSGTRMGMTVDQAVTVEGLLTDNLDTGSAHHGDCIGADADFHRLIRSKGLYVIGHPPLNNGLRAFCDFDECREPKPYLERDRDIIDESDWAIFTPGTFREILRSGTWATIRYARKKNMNGFIVWPDGTTSDVFGTRGR